MQATLKFIVAVGCCAFMLGCAMMSGPGASSTKFNYRSKREVSVLLVYANGVDEWAASSALESARIEFLEQANIHLLTWDTLRLSFDPKTIEATHFVLQWKSLIRRHVEKSYDIVYVMLPRGDSVPKAPYPVHGFAEGVGLVGKRSGAVAYGTVSGHLKSDTVVVMHEIGHLLGAIHAERGIMSTKRPSKRKDLLFVDQSIDEMHTIRSVHFESKGATALSVLGTFRSPR